MPQTTVSQREQVTQLLYEKAEELSAAAYQHYAQQGGEVDDESRLRAQLRSHLQPLADAVLMSSPALFDSHLQQLRQRGAAAEAQLARQLTALRQTLLLRLPIGEYVLMASLLSAGIAQLDEPAPAPLAEEEPADAAAAYQGMAAEYLRRLLVPDRPGACRLILDAARGGTDVRELYLQVLQPAQREVGRRWHRGEVNVAEEHFCTATTQLIMAQLQPYLHGTPRNGRRLLAACVAGDLHALGLQMVVDFLEHDGWDVYYLGASAPADSVLKTVADLQVDLVLTAASMPHHVPLVTEFISELRRNPETNLTRVLVGGRPFNYDATLWQRVGADAWAPSADQAVQAVRQLFGESTASPA
ncbi:cobalamin-dependent protein [Hymenobacter sp. 15J16-1T3B]|uniref:cobalamin B12-binding domain-containing protein n=1 Tax=Hymenobacter sp. 15J16-1T3B TaxID=2886941 RepID=UPI001D118929|nr:cobalamin-dependent protein [Hymenobacter sp. 15J16-1T3B]MCC3159341.1 cobalamin-dependent protein [Hymenobacter sp. 15J16-1T3B]